MTNYSVALRTFLAGLTCVLLNSMLHAKEVDANTVKKLTRAGAYSLDLRGKGHFRVPYGYRVVTEDKIAEFAESLEMPMTGEEVGVVMPDDCKWLISVSLVKADPLAGQDPRNINKDTLLDWQQQFAVDRRPKSGPGLPSKVIGWTHQPTYDEQKKRLTMGVRLTADKGESGQDIVRHQTFVYGDNGALFSLDVVTGIGNWEKPVADTAKLSGEFTFAAPQLEEAVESASSGHFVKVGISGLVGTLAMAFIFRMLFFKRSTPTRTARKGANLPR